MNMLNSVLFEGYLIADPTVKDFADVDCAVNFTLKHSRSKMDEDEIVRTTCFDVYIPGGALARKCAEVLKKGRGVRVVGRLETGRVDEKLSTDKFVWIVAEHVEFKPV